MIARYKCTNFLCKIVFIESTRIIKSRDRFGNERLIPFEPCGLALVNASNVGDLFVNVSSILLCSSNCSSLAKVLGSNNELTDCA